MHPKRREQNKRTKGRSILDEVKKTLTEGEGRGHGLLRSSAFAHVCSCIDRNLRISVPLPSSSASPIGTSVSSSFPRIFFDFLRFVTDDSSSTSSFFFLRLGVLLCSKGGGRLASNGTGGGAAVREEIDSRLGRGGGMDRMASKLREPNYKNTISDRFLI